MTYVEYNQYVTPWTDERIALLKQLHAEGKSATITANELGCTRNSVIGKWHRLGLEKRQSKIRMNIPGHPRAARKPRVFTTKRLPEWIEEPQFFDPTEYDLNIPQDQRRTILSVGAQECRWPIDPPEGERFFCGGSVAQEKPYCPAHCRVAFRR